jgi:ABC-type phosphate transport system ATPase subunit
LEKPCFARHFVIDERKYRYGINGPSGCGKSTYLRLLNRMNDLIDGTKTGSVIIDGVDIYGKNTNVDALKK